MNIEKSVFLAVFKTIDYLFEKYKFPNVIRFYRQVVEFVYFLFNQFFHNLCGKGLTLISRQYGFVCSCLFCMLCVVVMKICKKIMRFSDVKNFLKTSVYVIINYLKGNGHFVGR